MEKIKIQSGEKIGLISDIYGNGTFLRIAIDELIEKGVSRFIIIGDLLTDFQQNSLVMSQVEEIMKKYSVSFIMGNRDMDIVTRASGGNTF